MSKGTGEIKSKPDGGLPHGDTEPLGLTPPVTRYDTFSTNHSELVLGIVGPLGIDGDKIRTFLEDRLESYGYHVKTIRLSQIITALVPLSRIVREPEFERAMNLIDLGNQIRKESKNNAVLAIAAAAAIFAERSEVDPDSQAIRKTAYIVSSLKRPEEVAELRRIYGNGFYLFAVHSEASRRVKTLMARGTERWQAERLVARDEHETDKFGQDTRGTFHLADFFLADENNDDKLRNSIQRCMDLVFGNPYLTPTFNEFAMFMAFASSVRSADLSRQVGR